MKKYIGTKIVYAEPAPKGSEPGYFVKYSDGYCSWSPRQVFEESYRELTTLTFGLALNALKMGCYVARKGWNGKNMWLEYIPQRLDVLAHVRLHYPKGSEAYPDGAEVPWLPSQTDLLSEDWVVLG